jgi:hypothetical protein
MTDTDKPSLIVRIPTPVWLVVLILAALGAGALFGVPTQLERWPAGAAVIALGAALVAGTWLMWLVPAVVFALDQFVIIPYEERSMLHAFGDAYRDYQARVRRWL